MNEAPGVGSGSPPGHTTALRPLLVLSVLAGSAAPLSLTQVSEALGLPRATIHRVLAALLDSGWILATPAPRRYFPSLKVVELGFTVAREHSSRALLLPHAERLARLTQAHTTVALYEAGDIVYLDSIDFRGEQLTGSLLGGRQPAPLTPAGKLLLAFRPAEERSHILDSVDWPTARARAEAEAFIATAGDERYVISHREDWAHIGVALPVFDGSGYAVAALGVTTTGRLTEELVEAWLPPAQAIARAASWDLGFHSAPV